ncbi:MAG: 16S rRNA (guanine(966)-N(2))-methyltransferase RsmD [Rhodospirillaceae bacterium]|nr:16S rRNA (guanine(966)-N(2))-methyltransferase RsmD [Rhodospirillaceae bacterium]
MTKSPRKPSKPAPSGRGWLRIIGGVWRGRKIPVLATEDLRPTSERAREAIFNRLLHAADTFGVRLHGAHVADVFAGTGALGLEALSRGAASAVFIEKDRTSCKSIKAALAAIHADDRADVLNVDAMALPPAAKPCDIVLMDPPYAADAVPATLGSLVARKWLRPGSLVVVESEADIALPEGFALIDERSYGRARIAFLKFN